MSSTRRSFIVAAATAGATLVAPAASVAAAEPPPKPSPSPSASASPPPSAAASEIAKSMRRFDASLTDDQIRLIARGIDDQNTYAAAIRKGRPLHNGDEPTPEFEVRS